MTSTLTLILSSLAAAYVFFPAFLRFTQDSKEPPAIETSIPFISPLLGLIPGMSKFTVKLRSVTCALQQQQQPKTYTFQRQVWPPNLHPANARPAYLRH